MKGRVVWAKAGKNAATLCAFFDELGPERVAKLEAISLDMGVAFEKATTEKAPHVRQCVDPFHLVGLANDAINQARRWAWNEERRVLPKRSTGRPNARRSSAPRPRPLDQAHSLGAVKGSRELERRSARGVARTAAQQLGALSQLAVEGSSARSLPLSRSHRRARAPRVVVALGQSFSRIPAFVRLAKTVRKNRERILAAIELNLSNSKLEGLNSKIRLINHRGYGHHSAEAVIAMIYLCCGGLTIELPTSTLAA